MLLVGSDQLAMLVCAALVCAALVCAARIIIKRVATIAHVQLV